MMRVLILLPALTVGGTERQTLLLAEHLPACETIMGPTTVTLGLLDDTDHGLHDTARRCDVRARLIRPHGRLAAVATVRGIARFIAENGFDVVQSMLLNRHVGVAAALIPRRQRPKIVFGLRSAADFDLRWRAWVFQRCVDPFIAHISADAIVANSHAALAWASRFGYPRRNTHVVPNAIHSANLRPTRPRAETRRQLGVAEGRVMLLSVGRLSWQKRLDRLVDTAAECVPDLPIHVVIVGDGPERSAIDSRIDSRGLTAHVTMAGTRHDIGDCLHATDVFVHPSENEGWPNVVGEALAAGCICVATDVGETKTLLGAEPPSAGRFSLGRRGLLVAANDPAGLRAALVAAVTGIGEEPMMAELRAAGPAYIAQECSPAVLARRTAEIYASLLAGDSVAGDFAR